MINAELIVCSVGNPSKEPEKNTEMRIRFWNLRKDLPHIHFEVQHMGKSIMIHTNVMKEDLETLREAIDEAIEEMF